MINIQRAISRGVAVRIGDTFMAEFVQHPTLDRFCADVEKCGGIVHHISEYTRYDETRTGSVREVLCYRVVVTLPD